MAEDHGEHNPGDHEDPLPGPTWMVGFIGVVLLVVTFLGLTSVYYTAEVDDATSVRKAGEELTEQLEQLKRDQMKWIEGDPTWQPPFYNPGRVRVHLDDDENHDEERIIIPIDQAMDLIVSEYGGTG